MLKQILEKELSERKLSSRGAADVIGVSHTTILRALRGDIVDIDTVIKISEWLNVRPSTLLNTLGKNAKVSDQIAVLVEHNPRLSQLFEDAVALVEAGEVSPAILEDIISYSVYKLNFTGAKHADQSTRVTDNEGKVSIA